MFPRNAKFIVILSGLFLFSFITYWTVNLSNNDATYPRIDDLEKRMERLKSRIANDNRLINDLKNKLENRKTEEGEPENREKIELPPPLPRPINSAQQKKQDERRFGGNKVEQVHNTLFSKVAMACPAVDLPRNALSDVQMLNLYEVIPFDNPDGGVWKQGWEITYDSRKILDEPKLEVFVVPHSHNDPGWLKTFEDYFHDDTLNILNKMNQHLSTKSDMKFIYAEMSFFELWWSGVNDVVRESVKKLLKSGQLEIVTGGWVMTDEANSNYFASIMELIEGHEFMMNQLGAVPKNHWSIDPFGLSPTIAYLMNRANFTNMAIQRVHYSVKKELARRKGLEFRWRQLFAGDSSSTDMMTHMFPFYSYDVPHTCGPNPKTCCQFDFRRLNSFFCPWGLSPKIITDENVAERAHLLADQYRKKAQLYRTNVLLVPLGDDFRYNTDIEWSAQHANYRRLMDYINGKPEWNMNVRFGTLADYFDALHERVASGLDGGVGTGNFKFPVLSGDFFTYADRDDHYWSGYFTSRPFYKHMDRTLQHYLRSADIVFTLAHAQHSNDASSTAEFLGAKLYDNLVEARRALSLFQHHDGVTGTGKEHVMKDYGEKMLLAINNCKSIITSATHYLMKWPTSRMEDLKIDEDHFIDILPQKSVIEDGSFIVVFNPLAQPRRTVVCVQVGSPKSRVGGKRTDSLLQQIAPIVFVDENGKLSAHRDKFELCFFATLPALGFSRYNIFESEDVSHKVRVRAPNGFSASFFDVSNAEQDVMLKNSQLTAKFDSKTGFLRSIQPIDSDEVGVRMSFVQYGARRRDSSKTGDSVSGAYLFLPDGPATPLPADDNTYVVLDGDVRQVVHVKGVDRFALEHVVSLDRDASALNIQNYVDLSRQQKSDENVEVAMRLVTDVGSGLSAANAETEERFFTDLNNYQMIRRRRFPKLPLQAHFFPMAGAAFLEDSAHRVTLLSRQALGAASLERGWLEVMLDRRLTHDDGRGLGEPVLDNQRTESRFTLVVERLSANDRRVVDGEKETVGYHSLLSNVAQAELHYPPVAMAGHLDDAEARDVPAELSKINRTAFPRDVHLVALRTLSEPTVYLPSGVDNDDAERKNGGLWTANNRRLTRPQRGAAMVVHRYGVDCRVEPTNNACSDEMKSAGCDAKFGQVQLESVFSALQLKSAVNASLTLLYQSKEPLRNFVQYLDPMELRTLKLNF